MIFFLSQLMRGKLRLCRVLPLIVVNARGEDLSIALPPGSLPIPRARGRYPLHDSDQLIWYGKCREGTGDSTVSCLFHCLCLGPLCLALSGMKWNKCPKSSLPPRGSICGLGWIISLQRCILWKENSCYSKCHGHHRGEKAAWVSTNPTLHLGPHCLPWCLDACGASPGAWDIQ